MRIAIVLATIALARGLVFDDLYPFDRENDHQVPKGDSASSPLLQLQLPIIFYDNAFNAVAVHTDGFVTLEVFDSRGENVKEAVLAPFMYDLDGSTQGDIYYAERKDKHTLHRASRDVRKAFQDSASDFQAKSVFVATWVKLQTEDHSGVNFSFQCVVASDETSSFAIFLYPDDELCVGGPEGLKNELSVRAGFNDRGREELELLSAEELLVGGNARFPGEWIFQIGGVLLGLEEYVEPVHHVKVDRGPYRRESGFEVSEVNFNEDYGEPQADCGVLECENEHATCAAFRDGNCCMCQEGTFGNGDICIEEGTAVRSNGHVAGNTYVMNPDNSWTNETATSVDLHSYVVTSNGRVFSVLNGNLSPRLSRALQPMLIVSSTLGWMFASRAEPAINGFQYSGGKIVSQSYIRYKTGQYDFRIRQEYGQVVTDEDGGGNVLSGNMTFQGRLPSISPDQSVFVEEYSQVYTKVGPGTIRSRGIHSYTVGDQTHAYEIDQEIKFEGCEASFQQVPEKLAVDVYEIYIEYVQDESNLRFAMNSHIHAAEDDTSGGPSIGVVPPEEGTEDEGAVEVPPERPVEPEVEVPPPTTLTVCERQFAEAQHLRDSNPDIVDEIFFPTCTDLGTFAPRQCTAYDSVCWCVDEDTGDEISGTRTDPEVGYSLDCSDIRAPPPQLTPCEDSRARAEQARGGAGSAATSIYMPRCMESGAYEPVQQLPDGSFMCVDFRGLEISRSTEKPECLTPCQMRAYIAESSNIFKGTSLFVIRCQADGEYYPKQCLTRYCFCVDKNGLEIPDSRVETAIAGGEGTLDCADFIHVEEPEIPEQPIVPEEPVRPEIPDVPEIPVAPVIPVQPVPETGKLIFAQSMGINVIDLPITSENKVSRRLFARSDQTAVGVAYDCFRKTYYWTDISKRTIYSSQIDGNGARSVLANSRVRSPEGIAVDFTTGNVFWTDSDTDKIEVSSADGSSRLTLVSEGLVNPRGIAVDPFRGRMYYTDWNREAPKVWMANMDGSNARVIASNDLVLPNDVTIDFYRQRVCFIDAGNNRVECMSLDGQGREIVYEWSKVPRMHPFGLAVDGDMLFFSTWGSKVVNAVNWRSRDKVTISGPKGAHGQMYGVEIVHAQCPQGYNQCMNDNGGCPYLCLPVPGGRVCKCPPGAVDC